ncbi:MAG TPA: ribosomal protein L7/L12 [Sorangium sp.]|nr:ribosomal protein L7/L12 [Sorangium sp.]
MRLGDVELVEVGPNRVRVMSILRAALGLDLSEISRLVGNAPVTVVAGLEFVDAKSLADALRDNGAGCEILVKEVGDSSPVSWFDAPRLAAARDIGTLGRCAELSGLSSDRERDLRLELYWATNHPFRDERCAWIPVSQRGAAERENAKRLFSLLRADDPASRLAKANVARESADFATAHHLLTTGGFGGLAPMAARLLQLTDSKESALLPFGRDETDAAQQGNGE